MKYKLKEKNEKEFDSVITISELTSDVTINQLLDHLENTQRVLKEQKGQIQVNEALMAKAIEEVPALKDVPEDKIGLALSYFGKANANKQAVELIKTCEETIEIYETHLKAIEAETGIKCFPVISPFNPQDIQININGEGDTQSGTEEVAGD